MSWELHQDVQTETWFKKKTIVIALKGFVG